MQESIEDRLDKRLGLENARKRLEAESSPGPRVFGGGINYFHPENWNPSRSFIRFCLRLSGLYRRAKRNARQHRLIQNNITIPNLPNDFHGLRILHLSDLHVDMDGSTTNSIIEKLRPLNYDLCVLTGDYRAATYGSIRSTVDGMLRVTKVLTQPIYAVLGNHDSIRMVPPLEDMGINMLINEAIPIVRGDQTIYLAGIDDAHYYQVDDIEVTREPIPRNAISILLSHTPEIYAQAANFGYSLMFCGHTHGGQICLPGGIPVTLDSRCPRYVGKGNWQHRGMLGYTSSGAGCSILTARLNCPPEITIHTLTSQ